MSDLIERLRKWGEGESLTRHFLGTKSAREDCAEAATALAEAHATIARQQVMLDQALEASFDDKARADRAETALLRQGDNMAFVLNHMTMPDGYYGKFILELEEARAALSRPHATKGEAG